MRDKCARAALAILILSGCQGAEPQPADEFVAFPPGKADNYFSPVIQEYDVAGEARVALSEADAALSEPERQEIAARAATRLTDRITDALHARLEEVAPEDQRHSRDALIVFLRSASVATGDLVADGEAAYTFAYQAEVAGTDNLLPFEDGSRALTVEVGFGDEAQDVELAFAPSAAVNNTYPRYNELLQDGLDIYIHYGGDYNDYRYDIRKAKAMFKTLESMGFIAPVDTYDDLTLDSGPFVSEMDVDGDLLPVRVTLVHPEMAEHDQLELLVDAYKDHAATADVVVYSGHASEDTGYSGIVVHYNPRHALPASEFKNLELPDRYQMFVFSGCYTYTGYADELLKNPNKTTDNTDIITAVNSTPLARDIVSALLEGLMDQSAGTWFPHTWGSLLRRLNEESERSWRGAFGVHGLEQNPTISPLADLETLGQECASSAECPGIDNLCLSTSGSGAKRCGVACTHSSGCPDGYGCWWTFPVEADPEADPVRQCASAY